MYGANTSRYLLKCTKLENQKETDSCKSVYG